MAGKDKGLVVDQRLLKVSTYQEVVRGGVGVVGGGGCFLFVETDALIQDLSV